MIVPLPLLACATAVVLFGCGADRGGYGAGGSYCQGGAKGLNCYAPSDVRQHSGQRPPLSSDPPHWWQPAPPAGLAPSPPAATGTGPVPMSSPAWRPQNVVLDAGAAATAHD